jgi:uncharacterized membrane protein
MPITDVWTFRGYSSRELTRIDHILPIVDDASGGVVRSLFPSFDDRLVVVAMREFREDSTTIVAWSHGNLSATRRKDSVAPDVKTNR